MTKMIRRLSSAFDFSIIFTAPNFNASDLKRFDRKIKIGNDLSDNENIKSYWNTIGNDLRASIKKLKIDEQEK